MAMYIFSGGKPTIQIHWSIPDIDIFKALHIKSYTPFSSLRFSLSNDARISFIKLLTLSTDCVTKSLVAKMDSKLEA